MSLRFVGPHIDERTGQAAGLMTICDMLHDSVALNTADEVQRLDHPHWIQAKIPAPTRFARRRNGDHIVCRATVMKAPGATTPVGD